MLPLATRPAGIYLAAGAASRINARGSTRLIRFTREACARQGRPDWAPSGADGEGEGPRRGRGREEGGGPEEGRGQPVYRSIRKLCRRNFFRAAFYRDRLFTLGLDSSTLRRIVHIFSPPPASLPPRSCFSFGREDFRGRKFLEASFRSGAEVG